MGRALIIIPLLTSLLHLTQAQNVALQIQEHTLQTSFRELPAAMADKYGRVVKMEP